MPDQLPVDQPAAPLDRIDRALIAALAANPRAGILPLSRQLGVARNTVQARLDRLMSRGVITGFGPDVELRRLGYSVNAFVTLEIAQGRGPDVVEHLRSVDEVIEAHMTTGQGDLLCRVAAIDNDHLGHVINRILEVPGITRTTTVLALATHIPPRVLHLATGLDPGAAGG
ncbi:MAG: Lrp/AsnC family transcriptional regulator [Acidimicrobiales bacterium]